MKIFLGLALLSCVVFAHPANKKNPLIVGGRNALEGEAPYIASVQVDRQGSRQYRHTCGSSILSTVWILTAGHCITENLPLVAPLRIVAGEHNFAVTSGNEQIRLTPNYIIHELYAGGVAPYDIALLQAQTPLTIVPGIVQAIRLPTPGTIPIGDVQLFGWGSISMTDVPVIPDILQTVTKDLLPLEICREVLDNKYPEGTPLHSTNVCTGPLNSVITACSG